MAIFDHGKHNKYEIHNIASRGRPSMSKRQLSAIPTTHIYKILQKFQYDFCNIV